VCVWDELMYEYSLYIYEPTWADGTKLYMLLFGLCIPVLNINIYTYNALGGGGGYTPSAFWL
jgi:hypothetical protein